MTTRAEYKEFALQGFLTGLGWGATYVALTRYLLGETRSVPEILGLILGGSAGYARTKLESDESVAFTFFGPGSGLERFVKVIDGCDFNGHYWVFAAGLTNVGVALRIRDTVGGTVYAIDREPGQEFGSVSDILAIPCGPSSPPAF